MGVLGIGLPFTPLMSDLFTKLFDIIATTPLPACGNKKRGATCSP
jgi:hypothetical protein